MNMKRFCVALLGVFAFVVAFDFLLHGQILKSCYQQTSHLWRAPSESNMMIMFLSELLFAVFATFLYTRHHQGKGAGEGARFGAYLGLVFAAVSLGTFAYLPIPFSLTASWMVADFLRCLGSGVIASVIYKVH